MQNPKYKIDITHGEKELGSIELELMPEVAPKHVENFDKLVQENFYDGTAFHRVIPGFMVQGGDPNSRKGDRSTWGYGDPNQPKVKAEFNKTSHERGIVSAARSQDPNSASSQFFICVDNAKYLDGQYTAFGKVTSGMEVADKIAAVKRNHADMPDEKVEMKVTKIEG
ncbi:MAG: peptidylprolyl isomerase [Candidatus Kapaibacteriales bacterium]